MGKEGTSFLFSRNIRTAQFEENLNYHRVHSYNRYFELINKRRISTNCSVKLLSDFDPPYDLKSEKNYKKFAECVKELSDLKLRILCGLNEKLLIDRKSVV